MAQTASVTTAAGDMPAHLWLPPSGSGPGIVLLQEIFGVTGYIQRRAAQLAELGETRNPGLADLFVATMKGTYA